MVFSRKWLPFGDVLAFEDKEFLGCFDCFASFDSKLLSIHQSLNSWLTASLQNNHVVLPINFVVVFEVNFVPVVSCVVLGTHVEFVHVVFLNYHLLVLTLIKCYSFLRSVSNQLFRWHVLLKIVLCLHSCDKCVRYWAFVTSCALLHILYSFHLLWCYNLYSNQLQKSILQSLSSAFGPYCA